MSAPRIGVSTNADMIDGDLDRFALQLERVAASGAEVAEIIFHSLDLVVDGRIDEERLTEVKRITSSFPLAYSLHLPFILNLLDADRLESYLAVFRAGLRFSSEISCGAVVCHASSARFDAAEREGRLIARYGTSDPAALKARLFAEDAERLAGLADEAAPLGVTIGVENPIRYDLGGIASYGFRPEELAAQVAAVGRPNLGLTLDFGHLFLASRLLGFDYLDAVRVMAPRAVHCHIHDNFGRPDSGEPYIQRLPYGLGDLHLPPGRGRVPLDAALPILLASGYRGILMLEIEFRFASRFASHVADFRAMIGA